MNSNGCPALLGIRCQKLKLMRGETVLHRNNVPLKSRGRLHQVDAVKHLWSQGLFGTGASNVAQET